MTGPTPRLQKDLDELARAIPTDRLQILADSLRSGYRGGTTPALDSDELAIAYAVYRMPGTTAALSSVFGRAIASLPGWEPKTALDLGGGTGAFAHVLDRMLPSVDRLVVTDRSQQALDIGKRLAPTSQTSIEWRRESTPPGDGVDLTVMSYFLGEIPARDRFRLVDDSLSRSETLVVVEPGTEAGYATVLDVRQRMIDSGFAIAAPCPHAESCPLGSGDWCHFVARFDRSSDLRRLKGGTHPYDDEKFSYVVGTRRPTSPVVNRVLRHPLKRGGHVIVELCRQDGTAGSETVSRRHDHYRRARDLRWGDGWNPQ